MGTTTDKLNAVLDSKEAIRQAIEYRGVDIPMDTTLAEYADKIGEIPTGGTLTDEQALVFIGDCAEGKRKIAKAVRNKYEGTKGEASEITEYSTFEELSNKIAEIPITVPMGNAMEQNGGVLPFFDVYNETLKAMKEFAGYGFNGVCAFELDKWSYDNDHKVTLSGADAYYTSDGTFIKDGIIYKNGTQVGELDNSLYQFKDQDKENTNRFVVFFSETERYTVPKSLPATSCLNLWCVKGTPLMNFNEGFTALNSINVYDGELDVIDASCLYIYNLAGLKQFCMKHIRNIYSQLFNKLTNLNNCVIYAESILSGGIGIIGNMTTNLKTITFPNLQEIKTAYYILGSNANISLKRLSMPKLVYIETKNSVFTNGKQAIIQSINLDSLTEAKLSTTYPFFGWCKITEPVYLPKLHKCNALLVAGNNNIYDSVIPTIHLGDGMKDGEAGDICFIYNQKENTTLTTLTVAEGFKAKLNLTGCNGLERDVLLGIINNLGQLDAGQTLNLIMGTTLLNKLQDAEAQEAIENATRVKGWSIS